MCVQLVKRSYDERVKMYMKHSKKELAEMMARRDELFPPYSEPNYKPIIVSDKSCVNKSFGTCLKYQLSKFKLWVSSLYI